MSIIETRVFTRPVATIPWYHETDAGIADLSAFADIKASGKGAITRTVDDSGLQISMVNTMEDLETMGIVDNIMSIDVDARCTSYNSANGITMISFSQTGIDFPFTSNITYTAPSANNTDLSWLLDYLTNVAVHHAPLEITSTDTTITLLHQYQNSEDYCSNNRAGFSDYIICSRLSSATITRTCTYSPT